MSSTIRELADERAAAKAAIEAMGLVPVLFELGARPHPPEELYTAYLEQSHIFVGIYWQSYGWVAPGADLSGIEHEYSLSGGKPRLLYVKEPAPDREPRLDELLRRAGGDASYRHFETAAELGELLRRDLAVLITERFDAAAEPLPLPQLPSPATSFVGREAELATIERLILEEHARLLTLTGAGGIGKTRLAVRAAERLAGTFRDGAVFVPLEGARDAATVQTAVATAIGARDLGGDPVAGLCAALHGRRLLLVLDNFEQVIEAAPLVTTLLESSPELVVLVTSRELLRLRGEHELQVPPLAPEAEAVALFAERAAAARHAFELSDDDVPVVAEICRRLDGVPLAIEIAAPRLRLMSVAELLDALGRRLELAGPRDAPERQRTLEAAIAWSYELLSGEERDAFDRLGVFRASFTLEGAAAVCGMDDALDLLGSLLDKSIVYRVPDEHETRFAMLTMIREYALGRLAGADRVDDAMERLFRFHLDFVTAASPALRRPEQREWTRRFDLEVDNIRGTLEWLMEQGRSGDAAAVLGRMWLYWWRGGYIEEFRAWVRRALADEEHIPATDRGWLLGMEGLFTFMQGDDYPLALTRLQAARGLLAESGDSFGLAMTGGIEAMITAAMGDDEKAQRQIRACLARFEEIGDDWGIALVSSSAAWLQAMTGRYDETEAVLRRAAAAAERAGDDLVSAMVFANIAARRLHEGDVDAARPAIRRAIELVQGQGIVYIRPDLLESLSLLAVLEGLPELAAERLGAAAALREAMRVPLWGAAREQVELRLAALRSELGDERFAAALARGREARFEEISAPPALLRQPDPARAGSPA